MICRRRIGVYLFALVAVISASLCAGCQREVRRFRPAPPFAQAVRYTDEYENNAYALSEGKRLYSAYNCSGCHGEGGGGIGPPLMDDKWIYGYEPEQIFDTIAKGRSNGMPAFGGIGREPEIKVVTALPEHQIWQLVAYVRSLSGLASPNAATGRDDHMQRRPPENSTDPRSPVVEPPSDAGDKPK